MGLDDLPLNLGMLGMLGTVQANLAVTECDLLIAIGARFDDRVAGRPDGFAPGVMVVHKDIDPAEIGKNRTVCTATLPIRGLVTGCDPVETTVLRGTFSQDVVIFPTDERFLWTETSLEESLSKNL